MRPALREDVEELEQLEVELFPDNCMNSLTLRNELKHSKCWVVESPERQVIGYVLARVDGDLVDVLRLGVSSRYQGSGLGGRLLERALQEAPRAMLMVAKSNKPALSLYSSAGFSPVGEVAGSWVMER
jgi:ribosomal protein S18 acetylase RimI-like enzyme